MVRLQSSLKRKFGKCTESSFSDFLHWLLWWEANRSTRKHSKFLDRPKSPHKKVDWSKLKITRGLVRLKETRTMDLTQKWSPSVYPSLYLADKGSNEPISMLTAGMVTKVECGSQDDGGTWSRATKSLNLEMQTFAALAGKPQENLEWFQNVHELTLWPLRNRNITWGGLSDNLHEMLSKRHRSSIVMLWLNYIFSNYYP